MSFVDRGFERLSDLATVNDIVATLNQATDVRSALDGALGRIVAEE